MCTCTMVIYVCIFHEGVTGQMLYWIIWEAVRRLEEINLKVSFHACFTFLLCCILYFSISEFEMSYASFVTLKCVTQFMQVILFVCDGAKPNRKFLKSLGRESEMKNGVVYKTVNRFCRERYIYFMSDVPHLIMTTRNCWYSSKSGGARYMWVCTCFHVCYTVRIHVLFLIYRETESTSCGSIYGTSKDSPRQILVSMLVAVSHMSTSTSPHSPR